MGTKIEEEIFKLMLKNEDKFKLYGNLVKFVNEQIRKTQAEENVKFYEKISKLQNSINNAGWEERHSEQIDMLNKISNEICDEYEEYLP